MRVVLLSLALGILPLLGIVWTVVSGMITTVDGLFLSLILLTLSGIFLANAAGELRRGLKGDRTTPVKKAS
jgi:hypothetical protein